MNLVKLIKNTILKFTEVFSIQPIIIIHNVKELQVPESVQS